ncbi:MAG: carboxypeptidase-like regulatory domain-containing protein, partial [Runella slithyformis]
MNKFFLMIALLLWQVIPAFSQNQPTRFTITGVVVDSLNPLPGATVMLLTRKDSVLSNFTRANSEGKFEFKNIRKGDYLLKTSFVSYIPGEVVVVFGDSEVINLGEIKMKAIAQELMEVVVRTAKAPLTIRGDTIEYNAASFKVPPGSTVEDLLRKLPGVEVDAEGNIKAQGQDVKKLTVDGKTFF